MTVRARIVATAASTALPPLFKVASPASTASAPPATTAPFLPDASHVPASLGGDWAHAAKGGENEAENQNDLQEVGPEGSPLPIRSR